LFTCKIICKYLEGHFGTNGPHTNNIDLQGSMQTGLPHLSQLIINDLDSYMAAVKLQAVQPELQKASVVKNFDKMSSQKLSGMFVHSDHLQERLDFIKFACKVSETLLTP